MKVEAKMGAEKPRAARRVGMEAVARDPERLPLMNNATVFFKLTLKNTTEGKTA